MPTAEELIFGEQPRETIAPTAEELIFGPEAGKSEGALPPLSTAAEPASAPSNPIEKVNDDMQLWLAPMVGIHSPVPIRVTAGQVKQFNKHLVDALTYIDKPYRAIYYGAYSLARETKNPLGIITKPFKKSTYIDFIDSLRRGWHAKPDDPDWVSPLDVIEAHITGKEAHQQLDRYLQKHPVLRTSHSVADFISEIAANALIDTAIMGGIAKTATKVSPRARQAIYQLNPSSEFVEYIPFEGKATKIYGPAPGLEFRRVSQGKDLLPIYTTKVSRKSVLNGYSDYCLAKINSMVDGPPITLDEALRAIWSSAADTPASKAPTSTLFGSALEQSKEQYKVLQRYHKVVKDIPSVRPELQKLGEKISTYDKTLKKLLENLSKVNNKILDLEFSASGGEEVAERLAKLESQASVINTRLQKVIQSRNAAFDRQTLLQSIDASEAVHRELFNKALRKQFVTDFINAADNPEITNELNTIIDTLTTGRLTRGGKEAFTRKRKLLDSLDLLSDEEFKSVFDYLEMYKRDPKSLKRFEIFGKLVTPAWQWFDRHGCKQIYQVYDEARRKRLTTLNRMIDGFDAVLEPFGGINKARKNKEMMRRIFLMADGQEERVVELASEMGISVQRLNEERAVADYIKSVANELKDLAIKQGKLDPTGKTAPIPQERYITHLFKNAAEKSSHDEWVMYRILNAFEHQTNTKIPIKEFKVRWGNEGYLEDAYGAFMAMINHETHNLIVEPALAEAKVLADLTANPEIQHYTQKWINYSIRGMMTTSESYLEKPAEVIGKALEVVTKPLPEKLRFKTKERAFRQLSSLWRRGMYFKTMGFNPSPAIRNITQSFMGTAINDIDSTWWGARSLFTDGGHDLLKHCDILIDRMPLESFDIRDVTKFEKASSAAFRWVDKWPNVSKTFNESLYYEIKKSKKNIEIIRKYGDFGSPQKDIGRFTKALARAIDAGEFPREVWLANYKTKLSQYSYVSSDMPLYLWSAPGKFFGQYTSWAANYFTSYLPELAKWAITGKGPSGNQLGKWERMAIARHVFDIELLVLAGRQMGLDFTRLRPVQLSSIKTGEAVPSGRIQPRPSIPLLSFGKGVAPSSEISPSIGLVQGTLKLALARNEKEAAEGWSLIKRNQPLIWPAPTVLTKIKKVTQGEKPVQYLFGRPAEEEVLRSGGQRWRRPSMRPRY